MVKPADKHGELVKNDQVAGTYEGNGCVCTPQCLRLEVTPSCCGGICVLKYCGDCPIPFQCQYMMPCGKCYTDCDDEGYWTPNEDTLDAKCGSGFVRKGAPSTQVMQRATQGGIQMPVTQVQVGVAVAAPVQAPPVAMSVTVPDGMQAGQMLMIMTPAGMQMQVQIPAGVSPGQAFQVQAPAVAPVQNIYVVQATRAV